MKAETLNYTMLVLISSIVLVTLVLWEFEKIIKCRAFRRVDASGPGAVPIMR
jgi:hypothetical protein